MTEKRFVKGYHTIRDIKNNNTYDFRVDIVCDLLNTLHKENEQLKSEIEILKATIGRNESYINRIIRPSGDWRI